VVLDSARSADPTAAPFLLLNLARALVDMERFPEARELMAGPDAIPADATPLEHMISHWIRAEIALGLEDNAEAVLQVQSALGFADTLRASFRDADSRIAWQGRLAGLYDLAIWIALNAMDPVLALDFVERTRARAYLDLLVTRAKHVPDSAGELVADLNRLGTQRELLQQLFDSVRAAGTTFVDVDLFARAGTRGTGCRRHSANSFGAAGPVTGAYRCASGRDRRCHLPPGVTHRGRTHSRE
jgi:hypothetical protein